MFGLYETTLHPSILFSVLYVGAITNGNVSQQ